MRPLGQFADGDEGGGQLAAGELRGQCLRYALLENRRGEVGIEDYRGHAMPARLEA